MAKKQEKVTWREVYNRFKERYSDCSKSALGFEPYGYMTIKIFCEGREHYLYNDENKSLILIQEPKIQYDKIAKDAEDYWRRKQDCHHWTDEETRRHMYAEC